MHAWRPAAAGVDGDDLGNFRRVEVSIPVLLLQPESRMSDEPAAPSGAPSEGDDEFAGITPSPRGKNPLVAAAVIALALVLAWHLRDDLRYAFAARTPADLGDARSLTSRGVTLDDNRYVTIAGQAERRYALYVEPKGERSRQTIYRLLGGTRLFVRADDATGRTDLADRWTGRLRRFDTLPFAASLRTYYERETKVTRFVALDALKAALSGGGGELRDRMGEPLTVGADELVTVDVDYPGELKLFLSKDKFPSLLDARHELERMQLTPSPGEEAKEEFVFVVAMPDARKNEIIGKLSDKEIVFQPRAERYSVRRGELALGGDQLTIGKLTRVPWARVSAVGVPSPVVIAGDAFMLTEGEAPPSFWWAPLLFALLVGFAAFNVWYLARTLRPRR